MKSFVRPSSFKPFPKLLINDDGVVVLAKRHLGGTTFEGIVLNIGNTKSFSLGEIGNFNENNYKNLEGEIVLSN